MSKHSISTRETQVGVGNAIGKQVEQTVSVDDLSLPTAQELKAYQEINPNIVTFLIETSQKEQEHRHKTEDKKIDLIRYSEHKNGRMNWWGMFFAFLSLVTLVGLAAFALYLDHLKMSPKYWGFFQLTDQQFNEILKKGEIDESVIID